MANEYLTRVNTSTGNKKVYTWSAWIKLSNDGGSGHRFFGSGPSSSQGGHGYFGIVSDALYVVGYNGAAYTYQLSFSTTELHRDFSGWMHILIAYDSTQTLEQDRLNVYQNGKKLGSFANTQYPLASANDYYNTKGSTHYIGRRGLGGTLYQGQIFDLFWVDGQALTPEVFGFYKEGKGYQSSGSINATDFRSGQWSPRDPKSIKYEINRRGGFGVNGFYLPMNDSSNFGADFHCTPNSIIKLKGEDLPQPRNGAPDTSDAYVSELRDDPYAANLVLAMPLISGGQNNSYGDYSADIKGSGTNKTVTRVGSPSIINTPSHYGSALVDNNSTSDYLTVTGSGTDFRLDPAQEDWTVEFWVNPYTRSSPRHCAVLVKGSATDNNTFDWRCYVGQDVSIDYKINFGIGGDSGDENGDSFALSSDQWTHFAYEAHNGILTKYINGSAVSINTNPRAQTTNHSDLHIFRGDVGGANDVGFVGALSDLRIYSGVAKYKGGFDVAKPYTPVGIASWRAVPDATADNFCTMNPLIGATQRSGSIESTIVTYTDGNLTTKNNASGGWAPQMTSFSNFGMTTGKWYWECSNFSTIDNEVFGISKGNEQGSPTGNGTGVESLVSYNGSNGTIYIASQSDTTGPITGASATITNSAGVAMSATSDVLGFAFDADNSSMTVYLNGTLNNTATSITPSPRSVNLPWVVTKASNSSASPSGMTWNFGQNPTFSHTRAVFGKRVNTGNADSIWHQSSNGGTHTDWTISADGTNLQVTVAAGAYARAYLLASDGTIDPKKRYLVTFDYVTGPANLGVAASNSGGSIQYLTAVDGSASPNGLSSGNSYAFEFQGDQFAFTGFNGLTYELDNVIISEIGDAYTDDSGKGKFSYQPPTGFLALCVDNLPAPAIADPGKHFKTVLYTGDGNLGKSVTGLGFQPDLVWYKARNLDGYGHGLFDSVRGPGLRLTSSSDGAELAQTGVTSFDNDGFSLGTQASGNQDGQAYVAWCWKAGGPAVLNDAGSIDSQVSVNQDAGFSIVSYTGNGVNLATVGHGLNKAPSFIISKNRIDTVSWPVYHKSGSNVGDSATDVVYLNLSTVGTSNNYRNVNDTTFGLTSWNGINGNGDGHIAYCWTEIEGFSKFGMYTTNSNADGPYVHLGFKPAFLLVKPIYTSNWIIMDSSRGPTNPDPRWLYPDLSYFEESGAGRLCDFLSNGFKVRNGATGMNDGGTVIYAAFAESPFQSANAK